MNQMVQPTGREEWYFHVEQQVKGSLSGTEYCKQHGLIEGRFFYYRKLFRNHNLKTEKSPTFTSVITTAHSNSQSAEVKIILPNGFRCHIPSQINQEQLKRLIGTLLSC